MRKLNVLCSLILVVLLAISVTISCASPEPPQPAITEPEIPAHYTTYTKEGVFSISYPPEWEPAMALIPEAEKFLKEYIESIEEGLPLERVTVMFFGGVPVAEGYMPNVSVWVEYLPEANTQDEAVEAEVMGMKTIIESYRELSRSQTIVDGREATIIEYEATYPELGTSHQLVMMMLVGKYVWGVSCTPPPGEFSKCEDDFNAIVRSLRILH